VNNNNGREPLLQFFEADQPAPRRDIAAAFAALARLIIGALPRNPERTVALRKLVEARDCAIRAEQFRSDP
jgi:hypothetical protein